jgi:hypothetical protein
MNAKEEFLEHIADRNVKCAIIYREEFFNKPVVTYRLPLRYTNYQWDKFLEDISFRYDEGYGGQELFGTIWYDDGTWSERGEYDELCITREK